MSLKSLNIHKPSMSVNAIIDKNITAKDMSCHAIYTISFDVTIEDVFAGSVCVS